MNILQNRVDVRQRVAWLAWGGNWLPGTMIKQCLSRLPVAPAANNSLPPPTETSLPAVTAGKTELDKSAECDCPLDRDMVFDLFWDRPLDMGFGPLDSSGASTSISTASTKRTTALNEVSVALSLPCLLPLTDYPRLLPLRSGLPNGVVTRMTRPSSSPNLI
jgi:hypothetical protein